jgi:hypothetical protein
VTTFEIGDDRAKPGGPVWESIWPVLVDGTERAEIVETERGYRLRENGSWADPERSFRSQAVDDARNRYLTWATQIGHPASGTRYQETEINGVTWARVIVDGRVVYGPEPGTEGADAEYRRRYNESIKEIDA